jgi:hypothetical protein
MDPVRSLNCTVPVKMGLALDAPIPFLAIDTSPD